MSIGTNSRVIGAQRCTGAELNVYLSREATERQILANYGPRA